MDAGEDERGREVRARLLSLAAVGLVLRSPRGAGAGAADRPPARHRSRRAGAACARDRRGARGDGRRATRRLQRPAARASSPCARAAGAGLHALAVRLRADPRVARVEVEHRARPRLEPNDPALSTPETAVGTAPNTPVEWWAARSNFPAAWDVVDRRRRDRRGHRHRRRDEPPRAGRPRARRRQLRRRRQRGDDRLRRATAPTSPRWPAAAGNNGIGLAGAGLRCRLLILKSDFSDSSVAKAIVYAVDHGADAINMSFGTDPGVAAQPGRARRRRLRLRAQRRDGRGRRRRADRRAGLPGRTSCSRRARARTSRSARACR